MWSTLMGSLAGLALSVFMLFGIYEVSLRPLMDYDYNSFYISQTKSSVYSKRLFNPEDVSGKMIRDRMFTANHLIMLPVVDVDTDKGVRSVHLYNKLVYNFTGEDFWSTQYLINLNSIYDKHITLDSITPSFSSIYFNLPEDFNAVISGNAGDNSLIFYIEDIKKRGRSK